VQDKFGTEAYHKYVNGNLRLRIRNQQPIVPKRNATTSETYNSDIYAKAAVMLHTLRYLVGEELLLDILKTFATDPAYTLHNRVVSQDFIDLVERKSRRGLRWFFQHYLFTAELPQLQYKITRAAGRKTMLELNWRERDFHMPVEVSVETGKTVTMERYTVTAKRHRWFVPENAELKIDPHGWILMQLMEVK
jgi:aminopeptidase N